MRLLATLPNERLLDATGTNCDDLALVSTILFVAIDRISCSDTCGTSHDRVMMFTLQYEESVVTSSLDREVIFNHYFRRKL
jgi:hypothetical protein